MQFDPKQPMALYPDAVSQFVGIVSGKIKSEEPPKAYGIDAAGARVEKPDAGMIAIVPVWGALTPDGWYGTSLDELPRVLRSLDNNAQISAIVLNVRSPGGTVVGTPEAAAAVRAVRDRGQTKIISVANGMMASAAMWIGAAAEEVVVTPSGEAGSIGVISMYADMSKWYESLGVKIDVMRVPANKARFTGVEPLTAEMKNTIDVKLQETYEAFKRAMADNRGIRIDQVEKKFGGGEMLSAKAAVDAGLVDRIATLDEVIAKLMTRRAPSSARAALARAELDAVV